MGETVRWLCLQNQSRRCSLVSTFALLCLLAGALVSCSLDNVIDGSIGSDTSEGDDDQDQKINFDGFDGGTHSGTELDSGSSGLVNQTDASDELPDGGSTSGWFDMSGSALLLHMNDESGTVVDSSGNSIVGTPAGGVTFQRDGQLGTAFQFDGSDDEIGLGNPASLQLTGAMSISFWIKLDATNQNRAVISKRGNAADRGWQVSLTTGASNSRIELSISSDGTNEVTVESLSDLSTNWQHVMFVYNPSTYLRVYLNGVQDNENTTSIPAAQFDSSVDVVVGNPSVSSSSHFIGELDELAIWNRVVDGTETNQLFLGQSPNLDRQSWQFPDPGDPNPWFDMTGNVLLYHFNETTIGDTDAVVDSSPAGTDGTFSTGDTDEHAQKGYIGGAFHFSSDYIDLGATTNFESADISVSVWIKSTFSSEHDIVYNRSTNTYPWCLTFEEGGVGGSSLLFANANGPNLHRKTVRGFTDGQWHHVVAVSAPDPADIVIYVDGQQQETAYDTELNWANFSNPAVGGISSGYQGSMDELAVFTRRLSKVEALQIYERQSPKFSGSFESKVFDAGENALWSPLSWVPKSPYSKEFLDGGLSESLYGSGNLNNSGLVALWHFNDAGPTLADTSGNSFDGTQSGGVSFGETGKLNQAALFDGGDDVISVPDDDSLDLTGGEFSFVAWIFPMTFGGGNMARIFDNEESGTGGYVFQVMDNGSYTLDGLSVQIQGLGYFNSDPYVVKLSRWQMVAATLSGGTITFYVNGVASGSAGGAAAPSASGNPLLIGNRPDLARGFKGLIDEATIYSRALTGAELKALYHRGAMRVRYQVRSCASASCAVESWAGPDGTTTSYYSELLNPFAGLPSLDLTNYGGANRYFQYKVYVESDSPFQVPELEKVSIEATRLE